MRGSNAKNSVTCVGGHRPSRRTDQLPGLSSNATCAVLRSSDVGGLVEPEQLDADLPVRAVLLKHWPHTSARFPQLIGLRP